MAIPHSANTEFISVKQICAGVAAYRQIAAHCEPLGMTKRVMLITDQGLSELGLPAPVIAALQNRDFEVIEYNGVQADPSEHIVQQAADMALSRNVSGVIGFGGGSSMDVAKMVALLGHKHSADRIPACYGVNNVRGSRLPLIQIPTTAGTGSEVTPIAIITTGETTKNACVSNVLMADTVILDATFTANLPGHVAAATGIDAMVHALEAFTSVLKKNVLSDGLAKQALKLLNDNILPACSEAKSERARQAMLVGSMLAGQAFANAPVGAVHALAYPLGGRFHIPHGNSNALVLTEVMKFNLTNAAEEYAELARWLLGSQVSGTSEQQALALIAHFESMIEQLGIPDNLQAYGIAEGDLPMLAEDAMQQTRLLQNNPRVVNYVDALNIYRAVLS